MKLGDFEQTGDRAAPRFVARVPDVSGAEEFELTIDAQRSQEEPLRDFAEAQDEQRRSLWELAALEDVDALLEPDPRRPDRCSAVLAAARPVKSTVTPFAFAISGFFVPTNASLFLAGSFVLSFGFSAGVCSVFTATGV